MHLTRRALLARTVRSAAAAGLLTTLGGPLSSLAAGAASAQRKIPIQDFPDPGSAGPFTSAPRRLPAGTTHVGIHWRGDGHRLAQFAARTTSPAGGWSDWVDLTVDEDPFGMDETFAVLLEVRGAAAVQYRVALPQGRRLDRIVVTSIGADVPTTGSFLAPAAAAAAGPSASFTTLDGTVRVLWTREDWGCDESGSQFPWPPMFVPTKKLVVHHTATSNRYTDAAAEVRAIYAYHAVTKQWGDIGYNVLVDRFGNVYEGRRGREVRPPGGTTEVVASPFAREIVSRSVVAGHCYHHNYGTSGIAVIGDFTKRKINTADATDKAMLKAIEDLAVFECGRGGIVPDGSSEFLRSDELWRDPMPSITGHKDDESTACPGTSLYPYVTGTLRTSAASRLTGSSIYHPTVTLIRSTAREIPAGTPTSFAWDGSALGVTAVEWHLEGWQHSGPYDIVYWDGSAWVASDPSGWTSGAGSGRLELAGLPAGHFAFHVRAFDAMRGHAAVESNSTVLVK
ncbi:MAG: N-acetylmuramoyl-L-alanine amidase [Chloroflexi bacterium]|nr:N-acetylmuramoyl-L-alanine amidase [Chloroflexota bacterium]